MLMLSTKKEQASNTKVTRNFSDMHRTNIEMIARNFQMYSSKVEMLLLSTKKEQAPNTKVTRNFSEMHYTSPFYLNKKGLLLQLNEAHRVSRTFI
jgi:hypothetical protein